MKCTFFLLYLRYSILSCFVYQSVLVRQVDSTEYDFFLLDDASQVRIKRQLEDFDSDDVPPEEPGFWDRVVKVALRLFNKFIEWLNSS